MHRYRGETKMTTEGELFVDEDIRDYAKDKIDKAVKKKYGKNATWRIDGTKYNDYWDLATLPKTIEAPLMLKRKKEDLEIGTIVAKIKFIITEDFARHIEPEIANVEVMLN